MWNQTMSNCKHFVGIHIVQICWLITSWISYTRTLQDVLCVLLICFEIKNTSISTGTDEPASALPVPALQQLKQAVVDLYLPLIQHRVQLMKWRGSGNQQDKTENEYKISLPVWDGCHFLFSALQGRHDNFTAKCVN